MIQVVAKVCQVYADNSKKCSKVLENLSIEDAKCRGRENSAMWAMLDNLINYDEQFLSYCETVVLMPEKFPSRPSTPIDVEAQYACHSRPTTPSSPYEALSQPAPSAEGFIKWMFYLHDNLGKSTTLCVHPLFFVTFRHGTHQQFRLGDKLKLYKVTEEVSEKVGIDVTVVKINESLDFVLLRSNDPVVERGPMIAQPHESDAFTLAGFGNDENCISYVNGIIHHCRDYSFHNDGRQMGPFILGTALSRKGDSGAGIWGARGLLGMNFGTTTMPYQPHHVAISEAAIFTKKNIICPAFHFKSAYLEVLATEFQEGTMSPPIKSSVMTEIAGIGLLYGKEV